MEIAKPKLTIEQQVAKLKEKGVEFKFFKEEDAYNYLKGNNNFFKLTSYRKNFIKVQYGLRRGIYENLDFGYLVDLAVIDTRLRIIVIEMALNIEHFAKVDLLNYISNDSREDGYSIVNEYTNQLSSDQKYRLNREIEYNESSEYCGDLIRKYHDTYPIWAFVEIITFGKFLPFYKYCANKYNNKRLKDNYYLMLSVKSIRNAAAHNNCVINNLLKKTNDRPNFSLLRALALNRNISTQVRDTQLEKLRVREIVTLLYAHKKIVTSERMHAHISDRLSDFSARIYKYCSYEECEPLHNSLDFMKKVIDFWYKVR
jgi:abortive infection bacteriophage resistance protein